MHLFPDGVGNVGQPGLGSAFLDDALGRAHDHGPEAQGRRNQFEFVVEVEASSFDVPVRDAAGVEPPLGLFLCFGPTHAGRLDAGAEGAR